MVPALACGGAMLALSDQEMAEKIPSSFCDGHAPTACATGVGVVCTSVLADAQNCGACGLSCEAGHLCFDGVCKSAELRGTLQLLAGKVGVFGDRDGAGEDATLSPAFDLKTDRAGHLLLGSADAGAWQGSTVSLASAEIATTLRGRGVTDSLALGDDGSIYFATAATIKQMPANGGFSTAATPVIAGVHAVPGFVDAIGSDARLGERIAGMAIGADGNLYLSDNRNFAIRKLTLSTGELTTLAGIGPAGDHVATDGVGRSADFVSPRRLASDAAGHLFVADGNSIREIELATGRVSTLAGDAIASGFADGAGAQARFDAPRGLAADGAGDIYVSDLYNHAIRKIAHDTHRVSTVVGDPLHAGLALGTLPAGLDFPTAVAVSPSGSLIICDSNAILIAYPSALPAITVTESDSSLSRRAGFLLIAGGDTARAEGRSARDQ